MNPTKLELSDLGRLVRAERNRRGFSLREAASATGIPFNTLARGREGARPRPSQVQAARRMVWGRYQAVFRITGEGDYDYRFDCRTPSLRSQSACRSRRTDRGNRQ